MSQTKAQLISDLVQALAFVGTSSAPTNGMYLSAANTIAISTNGSQRVTVDSSGRVGIGTSSPVYLVDAQGGRALFTANSETYSVGVRNRASLAPNGNFWIGATNAVSPDMVFSNNAGNERLRITDAGLVGIGTSSPASALDVSGGSIKLRNASSGTNYGYEVDVRHVTGTSQKMLSARYMIPGASGSYTDIAGISAEILNADVNSYGLSFATGGSLTTRMLIDNAGILFSTPTYNDTTATAANVVVASTGRLSRSTSSIKYKTDVETLQDSYADAVLNCRPVWYRSTTGNDNPDWGWWGFIAEEVAEIDPRLVHWKTTETSHDENGSVVEMSLETPEPEGVQYDRFVPHLLNLIKRQQQAIETLEAKVAALEAA